MRKIPTTPTARKRAPRKAASPSAGEHRPSPEFVGPEQRAALIAEAAFFRAEKRGFAPGHEVEDWLAAEVRGRREADARRRIRPAGLSGPRLTSRPPHNPGHARSIFAWHDRADTRRTRAACGYSRRGRDHGRSRTHHAFNASAEEMFGYRAADAVGPQRQHADDVRPTAAARRSPASAISRAAKRACSGAGRDVRVRHRDGSEFSVFLSVDRIPNTAPPQFVGFLHDTSLRRKALATLEQERQRQSAVPGSGAGDAGGHRSRGARAAGQPARHPRARAKADAADRRQQLDRQLRGAGGSRHRAHRVSSAAHERQRRAADLRVSRARRRTAKIASSPGAEWRCATPTTSPPASCSRARTSPTSAAPKAKRTGRSSA